MDLPEKVGKFQQVSGMSGLPDSGAGVAEEDGSSSEYTTDDCKEEDEVKCEKSKDAVAEKLDPQRVLHHLRCDKCQAFFRGAVYNCYNEHSTCSLCCNNTGRGFWCAGFR